jgi:hypothetical protein
MAQQTSHDVESFRSAFGAPVLTQGDPGYDDARAIWNGAIDRRPAVIACCSTAGQVADAIRFARKSGLEIAVRGGGHSYAGNSVCDGGLMIHLGAMNGVVVDPAARRAVCGGGATWADLDAATQQLPRSAHASEAQPLAERLKEVQRRKGPQPLADIIPIVLARLGTMSVQSEASEAPGPS